MIEVTYPYHLGGEMLDGYQDGDSEMAQASIDSAIESAIILERKRIIKLLEDKRHHIKCDCECDEELIDLIKGEQK